MAFKDGKITSLFAKMSSNNPAERNGAEEPMSDGDDSLAAPPAAAAEVKKGKKMSIERIYQKKTQREHIIIRPDTYIGSVEKTTQPMWVYDEESESMVLREITFVPGLYKIFDEILVNAADNKQRDPQGMTTIKIDIEPDQNKIMIWNNGKGIPVVTHAKEKCYVPTLIFGHLLTGSNFQDDEKKVTGGRNGYGAKLCNVFSKKFVVETQSNEYNLCFKQTWTDNMSLASEPKVIKSKGEDFTCVTFYPDLEKFKMDVLDKDIVDLFKRRAFDIVGSTRGVKVILNGKKLQVKNFKEYVDLYLKGKTDENDQPLKVIFETANDRWEVGVTLSEKGFQQVSFVNSIATTKGGKHVDYIADQIAGNLIEVIKKKEKKAGISVKPFQVKNHMWVFVNCLIENPTFDSQTKENMTLQLKSFGSKCQLSEKFYSSAAKCGVIEAIQTWMRFKQQTQLNQKSGAKRSKLKGIPKLDDANDAGTKNSQGCTLILTEGDSAKTLAVAGLGVVGRDRYGVFPLKGKVLNVRDALHKQIMDNSEINNIIKIIGLQYKEKYDSPESLVKLRYGKLMVMTDQDQDGSHIKGLLINFFHHNWPHLLQQKFIEQFITPIVKVTKNKVEKSFYSLPEFEEWKTATENYRSWKAKYYKGLGTSTAKEAKEYFSDMNKHRIAFRYVGPEDDAAILLAFSKKKIEERKQWLTNWMEERKRRAQLGLQEEYLYGKDTKAVSYNDFVNKELILYSNMDNERSIPSIVDGLKPGQRKVIFTCLKRNLIREIKVAQLAGSVSEHSAYHHGEASLMATIIGLAQNFVGSNNLNLLLPIGQFGTRLSGGKDSASPRYIFTALSTLARHVFNKCDDPLLKFLEEDNTKIEPEWYVPILPMVLVNGAEGIGTGWSTKIPNYDIRELVNNLKMMIEGRQPLPMVPSFKNFTGVTEMIDNTRVIFSGEISILDDNTIEITELPIRVWTQTYKESVLEPMLQGTEKIPSVIQDYKEYHTDLTVRFVVKMSAEAMHKARQVGMHTFFKLQTSFATASMVLFDSAGCIRRYETVEEILREFYELRLEFYRRRKDYLECMLSAESLKLDNQARFIMEKIDGIIVIENQGKKNIIKMLVTRKYDSDPVKAWKKVQAKLQADDDDEALDGEKEKEEEASGPDYDYLLRMEILSMSLEKKEELLKQKELKSEELYRLRKKLPTDLWMDDLNAFIAELDKVEQQEKDDELSSLSHPSGKAVKGKGGKKALAIEVRPSGKGVRVVPSTEAIRTKVEAAGKKKKAQKKSDENDGLDGTEDRSLAERLGASAEKPKKVKKPRAPKEKKEKTTPVKREAKKPKKNPWSDEDSDEGEGDDMSGVFSSDEEEDMKPVNHDGDDGNRGDSSSDEFVAKKKPSKTKPFDDEDEDEGSAPQRQMNVGDSMDEGAFNPPPPAKKQKKPASAKPKQPAEKKPAAPKKTAPKKKMVVDSSDEDVNEVVLDSDGDDDDEFKPEKLKASPKKAAVKRPASKDGGEPAKKKTKPTLSGSSKAAKAAPKKKVEKILEFGEDDDVVLEGDGDEDEPVVPLRERLARTGRPAVKYNFGDSDSE